MLKHEQVTNSIIGAAIEVHRILGRGLLESAYERCLTKELLGRGHRVQRQVELPVTYKGEVVESGYRIDLVVDDVVIVEIKCVEQVIAVHKAQLLSYLKLSGKQVGLVVNFFVPVLKDGVVRMVL